jgi:hypothetical protein
MFKNKVGAAVVAVPRLGAVHTLDTMGHFFFGAEIILVGRRTGIGMSKGEVGKDKERMRLVKAFGEGTKALLVVLTLVEEIEVFGKEVFRKPKRILAKLR